MLFKLDLPCLPTDTRIHQGGGDETDLVLTDWTDWTILKSIGAKSKTKLAMERDRQTESCRPKCQDKDKDWRPAMVFGASLSQIVPLFLLFTFYFLILGVWMITQNTFSHNSFFILHFYFSFSISPKFSLPFYPWISVGLSTSCTNQLLDLLMIRTQNGSIDKKKTSTKAEMRHTKWVLVDDLQQRMLIRSVCYHSSSGSPFLPWLRGMKEARTEMRGAG